MTTWIFDQLEKDFLNELEEVESLKEILVARRLANQVLGDTSPTITGLTYNERKPILTEQNLLMLQHQLNRTKKILSKYGKELRKLQNNS